MTKNNVYVVVIEITDVNGEENQFVEAFKTFPSADELVEVLEDYKAAALLDGEQDIYMSRARAIFAIRNLGGMPLVDELDGCWAVRRNNDDIGDFSISICETQLF